MTKDKIKNLDVLAEIVYELKKQGKKIVHCHGVFDVVHFGHVRHFEDAKTQGDILIVTITPDRFIEKGPGRPFFNEEIRLKHLASFECIDYVALNKWDTAVETIKIIKPDVYAKGKEVLANAKVDEKDFKEKKVSNLDLEVEIVKSFGGVLYLTDEITFSSSRIINQITSALPDESKSFLEGLRKKGYSAEKILDNFDLLRNIRPLIIGDSVLDEYIYCNSMERSGKEALVAYKYANSEIHLGGVFAVANSIAGFVDKVNLISCIGDNNQELIENSLKENIERTLFVQDGSKTLTKTRYIEDYTGKKTFQIYNTDELKITPENEENIIRYLENNIDKFDIIIVPDFGHGMISNNLKKYLVNCSKFLAVNCQLNAGNLGYNFITKYEKADFVSINDRELRLPFQEKTADIKIPIKKLSEHLNLNRINVTLGKFGSIYYQDREYFYVPSFTKEPKDTVGSGDAVFSLTSLLSYKNIAPEIIPFLGNCIGALATRIIGNRKSVDPTELKKFVSYIMK